MTVKIKKSDIKKIVKECLVEILNEGISAKQNTNINESVVLIDDEKNNQNNHTTTNLKSFVRASSPMAHKSQYIPPQEKKIIESVKNTVSTITKDPIMASIFADTAQNTLIAQENGEKNGAVAIDQASRIVQNSDPSKLFEGVSENWAKLAFSEK